LISDDTRDAMSGALDLREELFLDGATHYTMLFQPYTQRWIHLLNDDRWWRG
jgi:hypothetical protein